MHRLLFTSDYTHALLWTWDTHFKEPTLRFSAFVVNEKGPFGDRRGPHYPVYQVVLAADSDVP